MGWDANTPVVVTVSRTEAITQIKAKAVAQGYTGGFKVTYDGKEIDTPNDLPVDVDMTKVCIASKLNNAAKAKKTKAVAKKSSKKVC